MCLDKVKEEFGSSLELEWRSFLLRPYPEPKPLEKFRRYTQSWLRPAEQPDAGEFQVWSTDEEPPSHSVPPNIAVKAAARQNGFDAYHLALMRAYFFENRCVTNPETLVDVARACGLDVASFERDLASPQLAEDVVRDHNEALTLGVSGVPCVVVTEGFVIPGAQERAFYRRLVEKGLAGDLVAP